MRVLLDANVYLSYLLAPDTQRTIPAVVRAVIDSEIDLLVPAELIQELVQSIGAKPYLRDRISQAALYDLLAALAMSELVPGPLETVFSYSADPNDDYLVAYGLIYEADYLITGDSHLLSLVRVAQLQIVAPRDFLDLLETGLP